MISGTVTATREAVVQLQVQDMEGEIHLFDAVVDTGFDGWLSLPTDFILQLGLKWLRFGRAILADGSESTFDIYRGAIVWDGVTRSILIYAMDAEPLVGMSIMYGFRSLVEAIDGGKVSITEM